MTDQNTVVHSWSRKKRKCGFWKFNYNFKVLEVLNSITEVWLSKYLHMYSGHFFKNTSAGVLHQTNNCASKTVFLGLCCIWYHPSCSNPNQVPGLCCRKAPIAAAPIFHSRDSVLKTTWFCMYAKSFRLILWTENHSSMFEASPKRLVTNVKSERLIAPVAEEFHRDEDNSVSVGVLTYLLWLGMQQYHCCQTDTMPITGSQYLPIRSTHIFFSVCYNKW